ncbi:hypothetical protein C8Q80DRAFT_1270300 [Daedaleopsis nitida]|nr:hypothetical protein C8Q80DRAFT_1270300 [Daedaleopsis nitida]
MAATWRLSFDLLSPALIVEPCSALAAQVLVDAPARLGSDRSVHRSNTIPVHHSDFQAQARPGLGGTQKLSRAQRSTGVRPPQPQPLCKRKRELQAALGVPSSYHDGSYLTPLGTRGSPRAMDDKSKSPEFMLMNVNVDEKEYGRECQR